MDTLEETERKVDRERGREKTRGGSTARDGDKERRSRERRRRRWYGGMYNSVYVTVRSELSLPRVKGRGAAWVEA
jgi:hypothetical protein